MSSIAQHEEAVDGTTGVPARGGTSELDPSLAIAHGGELLPDEELEEEEEEQDDEIYESSSSPSTETDTLTWINWFCSLPGHEYFCDVAEDFIEDDFNLTGLASLVPFYKEAMEMVLDVEPEDDESHRVPDVSIVESSAELLYGLIHQRYIITRQGSQQMYAKYEANHFGTCPRVYCSQTKLVPCGRSDLPGVDTVKLFCSSCLDMYVPPSSRFQGVDGAFFGTTFPHLLFQTFPPPTALPTPSPDPHTVPDGGERVHTTPTTSLNKVYVPRIYGFKVSEKARSGPRMQWMRMRPRTEGELDWEENAVRPNLGGQGGGEGGPSGEKGDLFDGDLDEEDDDEEEEEEDNNNNNTNEQPSKSNAAETTGGGAAEEGEESVVVDLDRLPRRTDRAIKPLPSSSSASPSSAATVTSPSRTKTLATTSIEGTGGGGGGQPQSTTTTTMEDEESTRASFALAASIQKHLALASSSSASQNHHEFGFELPKMPRPVHVNNNHHNNSSSSRIIGTAV